jgi:hypothetical protein
MGDLWLPDGKGWFKAGAQEPEAGNQLYGHRGFRLRAYDPMDMRSMPRPYKKRRRIGPFKFGGHIPVVAGGGDVNFRQYQIPAGFTMIAAQSAITGTAEALMWPYQFTAIPAAQLQAGQQIEVCAWGIMSTAAAPGTLTINPRWGTTTGGVSLGISNTSPTQAASLTAVAWYLKFNATMRVPSVTATSSTVSGGGFFVCQAIGSATAPGTMVFGGQATVDTVSNEGIVFGATLGSASDSITTEGVTIETLN